jgi:hypothetical protein
MTIYKCINGQLTDITERVNINGNTLTITVVDNDDLDENPQEGIIEDPIILTEPEQPQATGGGGGGGCSITTPTTAGLFNLLIMASGLAGLRIRRRK